MKYTIKTSAFALFIFFSSTFLAQKTAIFTDKDALYKQGLDLFDKKQYVQAQKSFLDYVPVSTARVLKSDAVYYSAACAIELFNKDGEWQMKQFVQNYPESNKINSASFYH